MLRALIGALLLGLTLNVGTAFAGTSNVSIDELNRQLVTLNAQLQQGDAAARSRALATLVNVATTRHRILASLIADHPELVLRHALSAQTRASLPAAAQPYLEEDLTTEGDLEVLHEDGVNGSRYLYSLKRAAGRLDLHFAADAPTLMTGDHVRVAGLRVNQSMALTSGTSSVTALALVSTNTFGAQKTALILVNFQDKPTQTWVTPTQAQDIVFGTSATAVTNFFYESSYQQAWLTGDVYGVYTIPVNSTVCDTSGISSYAQQAATAQVGSAKMATYTRLVFAFPANSCAWWGLGTVGGYPSQAWINGSFQNSVVSHEMGHNFGLFHSHALDCGPAVLGSSCTSIEYGDLFDTMGSASPPKHYNAVQKELLGWLNYGSSPPITTVQSSGTYTIDPYEPTGANPKALKVKTPSGDWYYVEYRQALGFDTSTVSSNNNVKSGVLVHLWQQQNPNGVFLLDMTPSTDSWNDPALDVGQQYNDSAAGITISTSWANGTAGVNVSVAGGGGGTSCVRNNPSVHVSPAQQQATPGTMVSYTLSVTNNDVGCAASSFNAQATVPAGWLSAFAGGALSISAGATASTTLQVTSPAGAAAGLYTISSTASDAGAPNYSATTQATYNVASSGTGTSTSFTDNFNRPDSSTLGNGWSQVTGLVIQSQQLRSATTKTMHTAVQAGLVGTTQSVTAKFAAVNNNAGPRFGLLVRYKDASNYYACYRQAGGTSVLRVSKVVGGTETILAKVGVPNPHQGEFFTLGCQVDSTGVSLSFNGTVKLTAPASESSLASGSVGLSMGYPAVRNGGAAQSHYADDFTATVQ